MVKKKTLLISTFGILLLGIVDFGYYNHITHKVQPNKEVIKPVSDVTVDGKQAFHKGHYQTFKSHLTKPQKKFIKPFKYSTKPQIKFLKLKHQKVQGVHVQLNYQDILNNQTKTVNNKPVKPLGFHNYILKDKTSDDKDFKTPIYKVGTLLPKNFVGKHLYDKRNLFTETTYLKQGSLSEIFTENPHSFLFYQKRLLKWAKSHPLDKLDLSVTPVYGLNTRTTNLLGISKPVSTEKVPRRLHIAYVGLKPNGKKIKIKLGGDEEYSPHIVQYVSLENDSPQTDIDYLTGHIQLYNSNGKAVTPDAQKQMNMTADTFPEYRVYKKEQEINKDAE